VFRRGLDRERADDPHPLAERHREGGIGGATADQQHGGVAGGIDAGGRSELSFRVTLLSITFDLFLLLVAGGLLAYGRVRQLFVNLIAWMLPFAVLASLETIAGAVHLSDHILMQQDFSIIKRGNNWGPSGNHLGLEKDGFIVYRPWSGNGVTINELGLRTSLPTPKTAGERHVALVGSSETWGTHLADADTIPALLQAALRRNGYNNITVYNFGIEDATLARELALLQHFKDIYSIDQVFAEARESNYDLIVTGSSQARGMVRHYIMGDLTLGILNHANCPVLVARASATAGPLGFWRSIRRAFTSPPSKPAA